MLDAHSSPWGDDAVTPSDVAAAAKLAFAQLRRRLIAVASDEKRPPKPPAADDERRRGRRSALRTARQALVHIVSAGSIPAEKAPRVVLVLANAASVVIFGMLGNLAFDELVDRLEPAPVVAVAPWWPTGLWLRDRGGSSELWLSRGRSCV